MKLYHTYLGQFCCQFLVLTAIDAKEYVYSTLDTSSVYNQPGQCYMAYIILAITVTSKPAPQTSTLSLGGASLHLVKLQLYSNRRILIKMCRLFVLPTSTPRFVEIAERFRLRATHSQIFEHPGYEWEPFSSVLRAPIRVVALRQEIGSFCSFNVYIESGGIALFSPFLTRVSMTRCAFHLLKYDCRNGLSEVIAPCIRL